MIKKITGWVTTVLGLVAAYRMVKENWPVIKEALDKLKSRR